MNRLARTVAQRRVKAKIFEANQRLALPCRNSHALDLRRRPDAQPLALGPQPVDQRHMKAVQLHPRVEAAFKPHHNARA